MEHATFQDQCDKRLSEMEGAIAKIQKEFEGRPDELIPILQRLQKETGFLPERALLEIAHLIGLPAAKVFGVATFYAQFRLQPVGKNIIRICQGTACHVKGANRILDDIQDQLHLAPGETTADGLFTVETVACFGSCALAPVVVVNDTVHGNMDRRKCLKLLDETRGQEKNPNEKSSKRG
jgi:NADH:ubiquinone oxidoreductase subunit E